MEPLSTLLRPFDFVWRVLLSIWCWGIFASGVVVWSLTVFPIAVVLAWFHPPIRHRVTDATQATVALYVRLLPFIRVEVDARARTDATKVLVVNHQSFIDPLIVFAAEPRVRGPARGYLLRTPFLRTYLEFAGFYVSDRGAPAPLEHMRQSAEEAMAAGGSLLFYPEGTRSKTGEMDRFLGGAFRLAEEYDLCIQPVVVEGLDRAFPSGSAIVRTRWRFPVRVRYLAPILPPFGEGPQRNVVRTLADRVQSSMADELQKMRSERYNA